ncbi:G-protein coupled receptors family 1 profile domain-containing protein [Caenorhabditis elegans]|uniref:G-protein coupled receptors family 1 profile domain-containing protein n=1 Tax=Caenorhabditis elegans TaxID=6239 RepID=Q9XXJ7_CAEEL|nr:G-protein coupled receptors family 1 profile domain-containing protein [Caenorhabditis elegans]CAA19433.2 G-protein coupled receptors family 1 profile domain-containing protein [Caenorhabditis elegans]|eukprot:NP_506993.2 Serpentine Receptor, class W [Caenorhabditis elegans]
MSRSLFVDNLDEILIVYQTQISFFIAVIGGFLNLFHFAVLTRPALRTFTIYFFMTIIAICDFFRLFLVIVTALPSFYYTYQQSILPSECIPPYSYFTVSMELGFSILSKISGKLVVWIVVAMSILRLIAIKCPLSPRVQKTIETKHGIRLIYFICITLIPFAYLEIQYNNVRVFQTLTLPQNCEKVSKITKCKEYIIVPAKYDYYILSCIEGYLFRVIPSFMTTFATVWLIHQLKKMRRSASTRSSANSDSNERFTKLVVLFNVIFLLSTAPTEIILVFEYVYEGYDSLISIITKFQFICDILPLLNGLIHFLSCFFMSSHYRKAVTKMIGCRKKQNNTNTITM